MINFERGQDPKKSMRLGMIGKLETPEVAEILMMYVCEFVNDSMLKEIEERIEKVVGFAVEVTYNPENPDYNASFILKIKK